MTSSPYSSDKVKTTSLQGMFEIGTSTGELGKNHAERMQKSYRNSPIYSGQGSQITDFTRNGVRNWYYNKVLNIINNENTDFPNLSLSFADVPNSLEVEVSSKDGDGLPATAYVPNFNSPLPGNINPADQPTTDGTNLDRYRYGGEKAPFVEIRSDGSLNPKGTSTEQRQKFGDLFKRSIS